MLFDLDAYRYHSLGVGRIYSAAAYIYLGIPRRLAIKCEIVQTVVNASLSIGLNTFRVSLGAMHLPATLVVMGVVVPYFSGQLLRFANIGVIDYRLIMLGNLIGWTVAWGANYIFKQIRPEKEDTGRIQKVVFPIVSLCLLHIAVAWRGLS